MRGIVICRNIRAPVRARMIAQTNAKKKRKDTFLARIDKIAFVAIPTASMVQQRVAAVMNPALELGRIAFIQSKIVQLVGTLKKNSAWVLLIILYPTTK